MGLKCTVVTYGVLIKALLRSGKKQLQETSFEILRTLPDMGISPGVEVYNQFLEHFARTHDYRQVRVCACVLHSADLIPIEAFFVSYWYPHHHPHTVVFLCHRPRRCCG
jgi:hypothetical protein